MGKCIFFLFFVDFGLHGIYSKELKDEDIFITNTTSTYEDIPKDCKLVGAEFHQDYPTNSTHLNITDDGPFWIAATIGFKRNINPIGTKNCPEEGSEDISLDKCNHQCQSYKYFNQGKTSCNCANNNETDETLLNTEKCDKEDKVLCKQKVCVVYRRVFHEEYYLCGTYRYVVVPGAASFWLYKPERCFEKKNFSFICTRGNITMSYNSSMLSWYEAYQRCKDDGQDLLQISNYVGKYQDGRTYWVSFFRRTRISWGTAHGKSLCVAAFVSNGTLSLVSKFCSEDLPALCYSNQNDGDKTTFVQMYVVVIVGIGCGVVLVAVVAFVCVKCSRLRKLNKSEDITRKQYELDEKKSTIGPMKENEAAVARRCSAYSLAGAYSDPINNEPTGKENEGEGCDQVTYQQQHTAHKENIYDNMSNLI